MKTIIVFAVVVCALLVDSAFEIPGQLRECDNESQCNAGECCAQERHPYIASRRKRLVVPGDKPIQLKSYCKPYKQLDEGCGSTALTGDCPCGPGLECKNVDAPPLSKRAIAYGTFKCVSNNN